MVVAGTDNCVVVRLVNASRWSTVGGFAVTRNGTRPGHVNQETQVVRAHVETWRPEIILVHWTVYSTDVSLVIEAS